MLKGIKKNPITYIDELGNLLNVAHDSQKRN